jgi:hypothetical protein
MVAPYRVLVTSSRDWMDVEKVHWELNRIYSSLNGRMMIVVHGMCPTGGDKYAADWVRDRLAVGGDRSVREEPHKAKWRRYGRAAGPIRNQEMADAGADECLAFVLNGSDGTTDCATAAGAAKIPVTVFAIGHVPWKPKPGRIVPKGIFRVIRDNRDGTFTDEVL